MNDIFKTKIFVISKAYEKIENKYELIYKPITLTGEYETIEQARERVSKIREFYEDEKGYEVFTYKNGEQLRIMTLEGFVEVKIVEL